MKKRLASSCALLMVLFRFVLFCIGASGNGDGIPLPEDESNPVDGCDQQIFLKEPSHVL